MKNKKTTPWLKIEDIPKEIVLPDNLVSSLKNVIEVRQKAVDAFERVKEPLMENIKMANSMVESIKPRLDSLSDCIYTPNDYIISAGPIIRDVRIVNPEDINTGSDKRENNAIVMSYKLPKNATWESLSIVFVDGHIVKVSYPNMKSKKFDFKDMGFLNGKTNKPDRKWELLRAMAENGGSLTKSKWNNNYHRNIKYDLNEKLKKFFDMEENPIPRYTRKYGYKPLFSVRNSR